MSFSPLATGKPIPTGGRYSKRNSRIRGFTKHHHAGVNAMGEATNPNRVVSAQDWIGNDGTAYPHIPEEFRAWTTGDPGYPAGAQSDHRNITTEISNTRAGFRDKTWEISDRALATDINMTGERAARLKLGTVKRGLYDGVAVHKDFVLSTSCPGPYYMKHLAKIIEHAELVRRSYVAGKPRLVTHHDVAVFTGGSTEFAGDPKKATFMSGGSGSKPGTSKPVPIPVPSKPSSGKVWPAVALPVTSAHTDASHVAWVKLLADVGYKDKSLTTAMQKWLKKLGYYKGAIDTTFGPWTIDALQRFLRAKGLYKGQLDAFKQPYNVARGPMLIGAEINYLNSQRSFY